VCSTKAINGQNLQESQVLQSGDRITLSQDGPEFIFEYQSPTPSSPSPHSSQTSQTPAALNLILKSKNFEIERSPTQLVIHRPTTLLGQATSRCIIGAIFVLFFLSSTTFNLLSLGCIFLILIIAFWKYDISYTFDLIAGNLTVNNASFICKSFNQYQLTQYQLSDLLTVRLVRSKYEGDEVTKYDTYDIYLERENGKPINLSILSGRDQTTVQQLVNIIDEFLSE